MQTEEYAKEMESIHERLQAAQSAATQFNSREAIFGNPPTDYSALKKIAETMDPFYQFWTTASKYALHCVRPHSSYTIYCRRPEN